MAVVWGSLLVSPMNNLIENRMDGKKGKTESRVSVRVERDEKLSRRNQQTFKVSWKLTNAVDVEDMLQGCNHK